MFKKGNNIYRMSRINIKLNIPISIRTVYLYFIYYVYKNNSITYTQ